MPREIKMVVYKFSELGENAQNRAIENLSSVNTDYDWWDFDGLLDLTQKEMNDRRIKLEEYPNSLFSYDTIYFDIYKQEYLHFVKLRVNNDEIFRKWLKIPKVLWEKLGYDFIDTNRTTTIFFVASDPLRYFTEKQGEILDRAKDIFDNKVQEALVLLRNEYEYRTSREAIIETIEANGYEFYEDGTLY